MVVTTGTGHHHTGRKTISKRLENCFPSVPQRSPSGYAGASFGGWGAPAAPTFFAERHFGLPNTYKNRCADVD